MQFFQQRRPERFAVGGLEPKALRDFRFIYTEDVRKLNEYKQFFEVHDGGLKAAALEGTLTGMTRIYMQAEGLMEVADFVETRLTRDEALSRERYAWTLYDRTTVHETLREFATEMVFLNFLLELYKVRHERRSASGKQMYSHARKAAF